MSTRYRRQEIIEGFNQEKLKKAHVVVLGAGGLGSAVLYYLTAAGIGKITFFDADLVEESNLNRQILHFTGDIGSLKTESALRKLKDLNPEIEINGISAKMNEENIELIGKPDVIVDALDNIETRLILNKYAVKNSIPFVHAAVDGFKGHLTFIIPGETPCLACIYRGIPPRRETPVIGATAGILGAMEAMEVIKYLTGMGEILKGKFAIFDFKEWRLNFVEVSRNFDCPVCKNTGQY